MKKALVFLMILAVAGGIFAEVEVSLGSAGTIGTKIDFTTDGDSAMTPDGDNRVQGTVTFNALNGLTFGLRYRATRAFNAFYLTGDYTADTYRFHAEANLNAWDGLGLAAVSSLWGYYDFLDGDLRLDVAYRGRELKDWAVSTVSADLAGDFWGLFTDLVNSEL